MPSTCLFFWLSCSLSWPCWQYSTSERKRAGLICGLVVVILGVLSLFSYWHPQLRAFSLGTIPESNIIISPLAMLVGMALPFLHAIHHRDLPDFSTRLVILGVFGIALTTVTWYTLRVQNSNSLQDRAGVLAGQLRASSTATFNDNLALIRRLADRQQPMTNKPIQGDWTQEVQSYLNDFPEIRLIGILDPNRQPLGVHSWESNTSTGSTIFCKHRTTRSGWTTSSAPIAPISAHPGRLRAAACTP